VEAEIVVLDADEEQCKQLCSLLGEYHYQAIPMYTLPDLKTHVQNSACRVVILDLDTLPVDKGFFRQLKKIEPSLCIMGLSSRSFHPGLEEAMSHHIYACLRKPVDQEELVFWIKSLF
jgi:DNA-binding NtrC family response regulator